MHKITYNLVATVSHKTEVNARLATKGKAFEKLFGQDNKNSSKLPFWIAYFFPS